MFGALIAAVLASFSPVSGDGSLYTGGTRVSGWTVDAKVWWHARLSAGTRCSQFFVNGQRRVRPCVPRRGWFAMYFDQGSSLINVVSNYFEKGHCGNLFVQYSTISNVVRGNVFVCGRDHMLRHSERKRPCKYPTLPTSFVGNRVWRNDPSCKLMRPYPPEFMYLSCADNVYCTPGTRQDYGISGFAKADFAKPVPPCKAGCDPANRRAEGLADVPAVFDPAPALEFLWNYPEHPLSPRHRKTKE